MTAADPGLAPPDDELDVVLRLKAGDRDAAARLFEWYGDRLYRRVILPRLPNRELAEDVLKDAFRLALERIDQYEPRGSSIFFWLRRIAINRAMDVHRAHARERRLQERADHADTLDRTMSRPPPRPDRAPEVAETREMVERSLARINPRYAEALRLRLLLELDRAECARRMNVTVGNFDVILHRACKAFRKNYPP